MSHIAPQGPPVAWLVDWPEEPDLGHYLAEDRSPSGRSRPLYLDAGPQPPAALAPLTDEQIEAVWAAKPRYHAPPVGQTDIEFARAIEAAHGIGKEPACPPTV